MMIDNVIAYWRFPWWMWSAFVGTFVAYLGIVITRAIDD